MKKIILTIAVAIFASVLYTGTARAELPTFEKFYMISQEDGEASNTSATQVSSYDISKTPYLYVRLSSAADVSLFSFWGNSGDMHATFTSNPSTGSQQDFFLTPADWSTVKSTGNWDVFGQYITQQGEICPDCAYTSFVVTPEPMSMVLYGMGGLPLALRFVRRRKVVA